MPLALVTGANRGIGLGVAGQLLDAGFTVLLGSRSLSKGQEAVKRQFSAYQRSDVDRPVLVEWAKTGQVRAVQLDVTAPADVFAVANRIDDEYGGTLHALVNNAAIDYDTDQHVLTADLDRVQRVWETNTLAVWRMCQVLAKALKKAGKQGRIVNVTSGAGAYDSLGTGTPAYSHSKAALNALTLQLAAGFGESGVKVNACGPGWVRTAMGGMGATRPVAEGASSIVWGVTGVADDGPTGGYFRDGKPQAW